MYVLLLLQVHPMQLQLNKHDMDVQTHTVGKTRDEAYISLQSINPILRFPTVQCTVYTHRERTGPLFQITHFLSPTALQASILFFMLSPASIQRCFRAYRNDGRPGVHNVYQTHSSSTNLTRTFSDDSQSFPPQVRTTFVQFRADPEPPKIPKLQCRMRGEKSILGGAFCHCTHTRTVLPNLLNRTLHRLRPNACAL